jgi:hypothetical protein
VGFVAKLDVSDRVLQFLASGVGSFDFLFGALAKAACASEEPPGSEHVLARREFGQRVDVVDEDFLALFDRACGVDVAPLDR